MTTLHGEKPAPRDLFKRVIEFLKKEFGDIFGKHYVNVCKDGSDYVPVQDKIWKEAFLIEGMTRNYPGITANLPKK